MTKYRLLLDERGSFNDKDKYIIIGGVLFKDDDYDYLSSIITPLHKNVCNALNIEELHGSSKKKLADYFLPLIGSMDEIIPVVFIIDKEKSFIFKKYDKISFKYNKAIEHLIKKLLEKGLIAETDELSIKVDNINISKNEMDNFHNYLKKQFSFVISVNQSDSKYNICIQLADIIVNSFSNKTKISSNSLKLKLMNPKMMFFLSETEQDYLE